MPLTIHKKITDNILLGVWKIEESSGSLLAGIALTGDEEAYYASLKSEIRRAQWLSYRVTVRLLILPDIAEVIYDDFGKPQFKNSAWQLSVSHSGDYAAVIIGKDSRVGIDIEKLKPRIERVVDKFLSDHEISELGIENRLEKLYVHWGAKESLYKLHGKPEIDFRKNIIIKPFSYLCRGIGKCMAILNMDGKSKEYCISYQTIDDYMLVYTIEN